MGKLNFYCMDQEQIKEEKFYETLMEVRSIENEKSYIALNQLDREKMFNHLKETNIDYYFSPYDKPKVNIDKLKKALENGTDFYIKTNIKYLDEIKKQFKEIGFSYEM